MPHVEVRYVVACLIIQNPGKRKSHLLENNKKEMLS